jgi:hypothetical protein
MFIITGKIGNEVYTIRCDSIERKEKDTDVSYTYDGLVFSGDKAAIDKMLKENTIDHGYLGCVPSGCECRDNYLSGELSSAQLIYSHVFDSVISMKDDWEWRNAPKGVVF